MRHYLATLALILLAADVRAAGPTCALLDPEKTPRAALLEAKLLAEPGAAWVERADIDKVLREQKLQAAFGPQGVAERVKLGKLLKADLLVMVRPVKDAEQPALAVVVSETATGLRLLLRAVPVTKNADEDVAALLAAAKDGIKRHGESVKEIVAVPPFVSQNLEFTHDHLKGAFAKLAEAEALDRRGVLVVELEEAEALAKEIALAAPGTTLARPLPVYLLGEFRHDGKGKDATVSVKLRAERGGKPVGKPEVAVVKPEESPVAVRKWSAGVLDALAKDDQPRPPANPKVEAKQLADRALLFKRLGNWIECVALLEASLLLNPAQPDLHAEALKAITPLIRPAYGASYLAATEEARRAHADQFARLYRRGLDHLAAFADKGGDFTKYRDRAGADMVNAFRAAANSLVSPGSDTPKAFEAVLRELSKERDAVMAKVDPIRLKQYLPMPVARPPGAKPDPSVVRPARPKPDTPVVRPAWYDPDAIPDPAAHRIKMRPIELTFPPPKAGRWPVKVLSGLVAAGPGTDVAWTAGTLYLMTEKGKLREVWDAPDFRTVIQSVRFDGRYVWCTARRHKASTLLLVLDPATGKTYEVTAADGLPEPTAEQVADQTAMFPLAITTLGPGRICAAGWLQRTWVAVVTFDPDKKRATVDVIHEAREAADREDRDQWSSTTVAFRPTFMFTLRGEPKPGEKAATRVFLGRVTERNLDVDSFPLVIDPDKRAVAVADFHFPSRSFADTDVEDGGAVYRVWRSIFPSLFRVSFPGTVREVLAEGLPQGVTLMTVRDGRAHVIQYRTEKDDPKNPKPRRGLHSVPVTVQWYVVEPGEKRSKLVGVDLPLIDYVAVSSHYGLVARVAPEKVNGDWTLQTVEFIEPKK
jgi:hypothetical protein